MRLIDADKVSAEIEKFLYPAPNFDAAYYNDGINDALSEIEDAETVDAVPVIRCKECAFFKMKYKGYYGICARTNSVYTVKDFCSKGYIGDGTGKAGIPDD